MNQQRRQQRRSSVGGAAAGGGGTGSSVDGELDLAMIHLYESISTSPFIEMTDHGGTELFWICLPISPHSTAVGHVRILEIFIRVLILLLSIIDLSKIHSPAYDQFRETTESTLLILQIVINKFTYFKQSNRQSLFKRFQQVLSDPSLEKLDQLIRLRDECRGYLFIACTRTEYVMSMTAWERRMHDPQGNIIEVQEHALIQRNIITSSSLKGISLLMHSYAGCKLQKLKIVCSPYTTMRNIMKGAIQKGTIHEVDQRLSPIENDPCIAFGSSVQIENDALLRQIWSSKRKQIQMRQQQKKSRPTPQYVQTSQITRSQSLMDYIQKSKRDLTIIFQSDKSIDLSKFPNLTTLKLNCAHLKNKEDLYPISHMKNLSNLQVHNLDDKGMKVLIEILPDLSELQILDLGHNNIGYEKMTDLVQIFPRISKKLRTLCLSSNSIGSDGGMKVLADNLSHLPKLRVLMLHSNAINDKGIGYLKSRLPNLPELAILDIRGNPDINHTVRQQLSKTIRNVFL